MRSTQPLRDALAAYDEDKPARNALMDRAMTDADVRTWQRAEKRALRQVQMAFYALTNDRNSYANCMIVDIDFMRKIAVLDEI